MSGFVDFNVDQETDIVAVGPYRSQVAAEQVAARINRRISTRLAEVDTDGAQVAVRAVVRPFWSEARATAQVLGWLDQFEATS